MQLSFARTDSADGLDVVPEPNSELATADLSISGEQNCIDNHWMHPSFPKHCFLVADGSFVETWVRWVDEPPWAYQYSL